MKPGDKVRLKCDGGKFKAGHTLTVAPTAWIIPVEGVIVTDGEAHYLWPKGELEIVDTLPPTAPPNTIDAILTLLTNFAENYAKFGDAKITCNSVATEMQTVIAAIRENVPPECKHEFVPVKTNIRGYGLSDGWPGSDGPVRGRCRICGYEP